MGHGLHICYIYNIYIYTYTYYITYNIIYIYTHIRFTDLECIILCFIPIARHPDIAG